jgi:hypothetical protein
MKHERRFTKAALAVLLLAVFFSFWPVLLPPRHAHAAGISSARLFSEVNVTRAGQQIVTANYVFSGLTASSANTLPFPTGALPRVPRRVWLQTVGNNAVGVIVSLDTSQGAADPTGLLAGGKLGYDATNIYVYIGNGTQLEATVEY